LLITASAFAFDPGEKLIWGAVDFSSIKMDKDCDPYSVFNLDTMVGYFLMKDISLDVVLSWYNYHYKSDDKSSYTYNLSDIYIGLGGSFFIKNFYVGAHFLYELMGEKDTYKSDDTSNANAMFLEFDGGYLVPLIENVFIDIGANYMMGIGEYGGDAEGDNTYSEFSVGAGIVVNLP
nr:hypothetical protein [Candidatus Cloacimonadota bacterium]